MKHWLRPIFMKSWRKNYLIKCRIIHLPRDLFPRWQTELEERDGPRLCWHLAVCFFLSVLGSGSHDGRAWCAVSTVTQSSLPLSGEGDLFKILLQASEPRRCHGMPKAECDTKGNSDKATEPTSEKSPKISKLMRCSTKTTVFSGQRSQSQWNKKD